ncbi:hypothetical protein A2833_01325 [Candidatus Azambacteria bacterium RIFCSPHIGHO2_01_FULL_44_55]|uniref:DUF1648 domain-containing protein n=1 Tax=Candidatus Azambacteria bacterium RIFCSPLOWO2_02_FULL_44_14 TaxID=1797306 RepID=A0A1F5C9S3_9BACT|nr:MAG: hypothetical protein A3A18_01895 [Candidatus Azambacteria bacterium RIFCSPLOWO2_01_FULL_44_84]OGD33145.1 MAG: hypothetical protein A3C78_02695 [Candidatus Azambacteria bacterium RIFCSPHIGHO2_02_FULL_45_18]OGD39610.1 MAG: hypothetical protein A3I30_03865 [Candidatus Azambacteria bacterium RIFCSPLOWO2_02_FULL_44_14]OGD39935.1 MAG: hypothetical protein A2833_01325 [Candidatus Azambacteria bacterium RIFCSPHIGHO2_01_FULL_44_55]
MLKDYFGDFWTRIIFILSLALNIALFIFLYFSVQQSNLPAVLHYNVYWGVDYLGETSTLLILPLIGFLTLVFNSVLGFKFWPGNKVMVYYFNSIALTVQIFLAIAGVALYLINR